MSEKLSWIAIRASKSEAQARFGIRDSKTSPNPQDYPTDDYCGIEVPTGWYVLAIRNTDYFYGLGPEDWRRLSNGGEVIAGRIDEQSNEAETKCIRGGEVLWQIDYSMQRSDDEEFKLSGPLPECYARIESKYRRLQAEKGDMDYLFSIPVEVCGRITGYRYDDEYHYAYVQVEADGENSILLSHSGGSWISAALNVISGLFRFGFQALLIILLGILSLKGIFFVCHMADLHAPKSYKALLFALFCLLGALPLTIKWLKNPWDLLFIPLRFVGTGVSTYILFRTMWCIHIMLYPGHSGRLNEFWPKEVDGLSAVSSFLMLMPLLLASLFVGLMIADCVAWCVGPARRQYGKGTKWASLQVALGELWWISRIVIPICLLLSFIGAATLRDLR